MKTRLLAAFAGAGMLFAPLGFADSDMQRAIAWEKYKDMAAARQARKEALHPSVTYSNPAERSADRTVDEGRRVPDPGEAPVQQQKKVKK